MNKKEYWLQSNEKYLNLALHWLKLRLRRLGGETIHSQEIDKAYIAMETAAANQPYPALVSLSQSLGLSRFEQQVLLLCAGMEWDIHIASLCAKAQKNPQLTYPTFALALSLFDEATWDVVSPNKSLRYWRLIEINQERHQPLISSALRADEPIVNYLKGLHYLDERLATLVMPLEVSTAILPPSQKNVVEQIIKHIQTANYGGNLPIIQLLGTDSSSKQLIASYVASQLGFKLYRLPSGLLPKSAGELENFLRLWDRESRLTGVVLYLDTQEFESRLTSARTFPIYIPLLRYHNLLFLDTPEAKFLQNKSTVTFEITKPTASEQQTAWSEILGDAALPESPVLLASQFNLNLTTIEGNARITRDENLTDKSQFHTRLWEKCLISTRPQLDNLAQPIDTKATWNDIVLPKEELGLLQQIADQVKQRRQVYETWGFAQKMNRGMGISAMFAGESGTGKTMAAEVIANSLHLNLYRIDLSAVVSKYIGETEKNLRRLFDAAEDGGAILFFDEADALFGKRSEVNDSHDRYANIEINYLLQRIESYRGLAILATNFKSSLDAAFLRRLRFIINFPFPGKSQRKLMWQKVFPQETPTEELDFERLGRLNLTGGSIHNIALNAAFLAANVGTAVTMELVLKAAKTEFRKLERPINEADFIFN